jgi:hypothetical protein
MPNASTLAAMAPGLVKGGERAPREPAGRCPALAHLSEAPVLQRADRRQRSEAARGGEGGTQEPYGHNLEATRQERHTRLQEKRDRPQPSRRGHIPQGPGKTRPLGRSACEAKGVQDAVRAGLEALYAPAGLAGSDGCRPGRSAHDAGGRLKRQVERGAGPGIVAAALGSCFDSGERPA